jgi:plasmid maintenance system antidote protein VapI
LIGGRKGQYSIRINDRWRICGTSAEFWLNLQSLYELRLAQQKAGKSIQALPTLKRRDPVPA